MQFCQSCSIIVRNQLFVMRSIFNSSSHTIQVKYEPCKLHDWIPCVQKHGHIILCGMENVYSDSTTGNFLFILYVDVIHFRTWNDSICHSSVHIIKLVYIRNNLFSFPLGTIFIILPQIHPHAIFIFAESELCIMG